MAISGLLALVILTGFCFFYYNLPVHEESKTGASDYLWEKNVITMRGTEGFAFAKLDENGYANSFETNRNVVDVLIMGSSHGEGFNVNYDKNFTYQLNKLFKENKKDKYAYNISVSEHTIVHCLKNLEAAIKEFKPQEYVVIETPKVVMESSRWTALNKGEFPDLEANSVGVINYLQKVDFFRLMYAQGVSFLHNSKSVVTDDTEAKVDLEEYRKALEVTISNAAKTVEGASCKLAIVYIRPVDLNTDGSVKAFDAPEEHVIFKELCEKYNVIFIDMYDTFAKHYEDTNCLPHGFSNTKVGTGHMNKTGHRLVAERLYEVIEKGAAK